MSICFPCVRVDCENQSDVQLYSLQSGLNFTSPLLSFIVSCPVGYICVPGTFSQTITYPPGTWVIVIPPNVPPGFVLRLQGCQSEVVRVVPVGATAAQINALAQQIIAEVAAQQAQCDVINPPSGGTPGPEVRGFTNNYVYFVHDCPTNYCLSFTGTLPDWIQFDDPNNRFIGIRGFFAGATQLEADQRAQAALDAFGTAALDANQLVCGMGFQNTLQSAGCTPPSTDQNHTTFPIDGNGIYTVDGTVYAAAGYYFSCVDQGNADAQALAAAQARFNQYVSLDVIDCLFDCGATPTNIADVVWASSIVINNTGGGSATGLGGSGSITINLDEWVGPPVNGPYGMGLKLTAVVCNPTASAVAVQFSFGCNATFNDPSPAFDAMGCQVSVNAITVWSASTLNPTPAINNPVINIPAFSSMTFEVVAVLSQNAFFTNGTSTASVTFTAVQV